MLTLTGFKCSGDRAEINLITSKIASQVWKGQWKGAQCAKQDTSLTWDAEIISWRKWHGFSFISLILEPYIWMIGTYPWVCTHGSLLEGLGRPYGVLGTKPSLAAFKANSLPGMLSHQPPSSFLFNFGLGPTTILYSGNHTMLGMASGLPECKATPRKCSGSNSWQCLRGLYVVRIWTKVKLT